MSSRALSPHQFDFAFHPSTHKEMGGVPYHTVEAWPKEQSGSDWARMHPGERQYWYGSAVAGEAPASSISWHHQTGEILGVFTQEQYKRQGLATAALGEARRIASETRGVRQPRHSPNRTESGEAWARSLGERLPKKTVLKGSIGEPRPA